MKNDRQTYKDQYSPSGGLARMIYNGLPLARGNIDGESIAQLQSANVITIAVRSYLLIVKSKAISGIDSAPFCHSRKLLSGILERIQNKIPVFAGMTNKCESSLSLGKPPTDFSELDIGESIRRLFGGRPDVECDIGLMLDKLISSELETTRLTVDEVRNGCCLTMDSTRFQLCQN